MVNTKSIKRRMPVPKHPGFDVRGADLSEYCRISEIA